MINNVTLVGRIAGLYKDNLKASYITVAVTNRYGSTDFIPVVCFGKNKEIIDKYFSKGQWISIVGRISVQETGDKEKRINVVANEISFTGEKKEREKDDLDKELDNLPDYEFNNNDDDLPF